MKSKILRLFIVVSVLFIVSLSANGQIKRAHVGNWNFNIPTEVSGFSNGIMDFKKDSIIITFTGDTFKYPSTWVKVKKDSVIFEINIQGEDVLCSLKIENRKNIKGNAVWSFGETIVILKKE